MPNILEKNEKIERIAKDRKHKKKSPIEMSELKNTMIRINS